MKKLDPLLLLLSLSFLCGCALAPGENSDGIDMEEWCSRDESMPWTGCWTEVAQLDCESGQEFEPEETIGEFRNPDWETGRWVWLAGIFVGSALLLVATPILASWGGKSAEEAHLAPLGLALTRTPRLELDLIGLIGGGQN